MDSLDTFLQNKKQSVTPVYFILSGMVIYGKVEDFDSNHIFLSKVAIFNDNNMGLMTINRDDIVAWGDKLQQLQ